MNVAEVLVEVLADAGVQRIYGVPGDAVNGVLDAIRRQDRLEFVQVRHEEAGAFAASAEAKLTGLPAACIGTAGPGAIHLLNGLYDARADHAPVIAITGQVSRANLGTDAHQEIDLDALFQGVEVYGQTVVHPEQMPDVAIRACRAAQARRGVARITIPEDIVSESVPGGEQRSSSAIEVGEQTAAAEQLARAAKCIADSQRPTIMVERGARACVDDVVALAQRIGTPIVRSLQAEDVLPDSHELSMGGHGLLGTTASVHAMEHCDLLLLAGTDFPYREFYPDGGPAAIQIDHDPERLGRRFPIDVGLLGHVGPAVRGLLERVPERGERTFLEGCQKSKAHWEKLRGMLEHADHSPIHPQHLARRVGELADPQSIFVCDTGAVTAWVARHMPVTPPQRFTLSGNLASMGFGLPGAIGAALSHPGRPVVALVGDGGLSMLPSDLLTAVRHELPITLIVFNNGKLGLIQMEQEVEGFPENETALQAFDFVNFALSCGARGRRVDDHEWLDEALREALVQDGPFLLDVRVNPDEITLPPRIQASQAFGFGLAKLKEFFAQFGS
ncbi:thiamine pyrophosphate-dependent enzyme [Engelhardtia mirabilis]|uniref:Thiamine pyrophosphate-containing protein YdaP n=1 Tax=Engelhardtia mirabilis TaxID=2528011 RepID=A0A518BJJ0_9BACT|nr:Putative thiamine pyrophosphate-containing protein YdaP [Planctomycetes bacterium Pla133]QDV01459.1 Putative thiamine pyrophosphate-containing protein YdaP [Planctomycetes bacterium Pla86]